MPRIARRFVRRRRERPAPYAVRRDGLYYIEVWGAFYSPTWVDREQAGRFTNKKDAAKVARVTGGEVVTL